jgi:acyl carrier protein
VVFSSISGVWGSGGQGVYSAGNAFLDAFVLNRRSRGLAGTAVAWGPWAGGGMVDARVAKELTRRGVTPMAPDLALAALGDAVGRREECVTVADVDWARFAPAFTAIRPSRLWAELPAARDALTEREPTIDPDGWAARLAPLPPAERTDVVLAMVREQTAAVLGHRDVSAVPATRAFKELGFDSLTAVELRDAIAGVTGVKLEATVVFDHPTPAALAAAVVAVLSPDGGERTVLAELDRLEAALGREVDDAGDLRDTVAARLRAMLAAWTRQTRQSTAPAVAERLGGASDDELLAFINKEFGRNGRDCTDRCGCCLSAVGPGKARPRAGG